MRNRSVWWRPDWRRLDLSMTIVEEYFGDCPFALVRLRPVLSSLNAQCRNCKRKSIVWKVRIHCIGFAVGGVMDLNLVWPLCDLCVTFVVVFCVFSGCFRLFLIASITCITNLLGVLIVDLIECRRTCGRKGEMQGSHGRDGSYSARYPVNVDLCSACLTAVCIFDVLLTNCCLSLTFMKIPI